MQIFDFSKMGYSDSVPVNKFAEPDYVENDTWNTPMYKVPFSGMNGGVPLYVPANENLDKVAEYNPWMEGTTVGGMIDEAMGKLLAVPGINALASAYFAGRGVQGLVADNGVKKTKNLIGEWYDALKQGDMKNADELQRQAGWSALGDIANIAMVIGGVPAARKIASEVNKVRAQKSFNKEVDSVFDEVLKEKPQQEVHEVLLDENGKIRTRLTNEQIGKIEKEAAYNKMMKDAGFDPVTGDRITTAKNADGKRVNGAVNDIRYQIVDR